MNEETAAKRLVFLDLTGKQSKAILGERELHAVSI
jgi:hypothetical protein